jgi:hypothetical protein
VELGQPQHHHRTIIAADYNEDGVLGRLLGKCPVLESLTLPSAPAETFFRVGERPLRFLSVDAGYDHQEFIRNLARSTCFPDLRCLDFGEYHETFEADYQSRCTPLPHYDELFGSPVFASVKRFVWRNPPCTDDEVRRLRHRRPDLQLLVVRTTTWYA